MPLSLTWTDRAPATLTPADADGRVMEMFAVHVHISREEMLAADFAELMKRLIEPSIAQIRHQLKALDAL